MQQSTHTEKFLKTKSEFTSVVSRLTLIHLSDLHLSKALNWQQNVILSSLKDDLEQRISRLGLENVHTAISGDLAFGGKAEEYELVKSFLSDLKAIGVQKTVVAPGNHDLNWDKRLNAHQPTFEVLLSGSPSAASDLEKLFKRNVDRDQLRSGMTDYYNFLEEIGQDYNEYLYSLYSTSMEGVTVNFISLNSAYLFTPNNTYYGYLGATQIERATAEAQIVANSARCKAFNICMFHHPFKAIAPAVVRSTEDLIKSRCDIILSGHVHHLEVSVDLTAHALGADFYQKYPVISSARCVYDEERDPFVQPGYSIFQLDFDESKAGVVTKVYEVSFDKTAQKWHSISGDIPFTFDFLAYYALNRLREFGYSRDFPTMRESQYSPQSVLVDGKVNKIDFMGIFASKWVMPENSKKLEAFLSRPKSQIRFLLLDNEGKAFTDFNASRKGMLSTKVFDVHKELAKKFSNYRIKLFDHLPKFRLLFVNDESLAFSIHELDYDNYITRRSEWDSSLLVFEKIPNRLTLFDFFRDYFEQEWNGARDLS